jgi:hypothetical protein
MKRESVSYPTIGLVKARMAGTSKGGSVREPAMRADAEPGLQARALARRPEGVESGEAPQERSHITSARGSSVFWYNAGSIVHIESRRYDLFGQIDFIWVVG